MPPNMHSHLQETTNLLFVTTDYFTISRIYVHRIMCPYFLCFLKTQHIYFEINSSDSMYQSFILFIAEYYFTALVFHCLAIHLLMDGWVVSSLGLLQRKPRWIFMDKFLCRHSFYFSWLKVKWLGHMIGVCLMF